MRSANRGIRYEERTQTNADATAVAAIARETAAPTDLVKALYAQEIARLNAQARLKQFVHVIAMNRVKQQLRKLVGHSAGSDPEAT